jgi:NitT/TauT family transport system substrate-binding protein
MTQIKNGIVTFVLLLIGQVSVLSAQNVLTMSYSAISPTNAGVWMAQETGAFRRNGLDIKLVYIPSASTNIQALLGGSLEVAHAGSSAVIVAASQGAPVVAVAAPQNRPVYTLWVQSDVQRIEDLRGKTLAISRFNSSTHFVTALVLRKFGIDKEVTIRPLGGVPEMLAAFVHGQAAGIFTANPPDKGKPLLNAAELGIPYATGVIAINRGYLQSRRSMIKQLLRGYSEGVAEIFRQREKSIEVLKKYLRRQDERLLEEMYDQLRNYTERIPRIDPQIVDSIQSVIGKERAIRAETVIDNSLVDELVAEGFYTKLYGKEVR